MSTGHALAQEQLRDLAEAGALESEADPTVDESGQLLILKVTLRFQPIDRIVSGLPVHAREAFTIYVDKDFPFSTPQIYVPHQRFAGFPHVQWTNKLCLYQAPAVDWDPAAGLYGLVERLDGWVRAAAINELDPEDAPLHPPVAYRGSNRLVIPIADAPTTTDKPWIGFAVLREQGKRTEVVDWVPLGDETPDYFAAAMLLPKPLPFEFPSKVDDLTKELEKQGISYGLLVQLLAVLSLRLPAGSPLLVVLGTPMRRVKAGGPLLPHLVAWEIVAEAADQLRLLNAYFADLEELREIGEEAKKKVAEWSVTANVSWCHVREMRPAVTRRRDIAAASTWFQGKTVELWGCGAIGSHIAESIVRAGARCLVLRDNGRVMPGLLVRQAFDDEDVGEWKVHALAARLKRIDPDLEIETSIDNLCTHVDDPSALNHADVVIDSTGSNALRLKLERCLRASGVHTPMVSLSVSYNAQAGMATLAPQDYVGGSTDVIRRLKLEACQRKELSSILDAFWPKEPRRERFQPEPGCSEPTFVGSDVDLAVLSARMLNAVANKLANGDCSHPTGWLLHAQGHLHEYNWFPDIVIGERSDRYQIRVSHGALREMRGWARRSRRTCGNAVETGGLLFGELNEAAGVLWVTESEGPPPDSDSSQYYFTCGITGMAEANEEKRKRTRRSVSCIGTWHTHPSSPALPSEIDLGAVGQLLACSESSRRHCLLLIMASDLGIPTIGAYVFRTSERTNRFMIADVVTGSRSQVPERDTDQRNIGLALSGGGARAMAFHLGCMRALYDLELLSRLEVVSGVSGGSVIAALYAYRSGSFEDFEALVTKRLRRGYVRDIFRNLLRPSRFLPTLITFVIGGAIGLGRAAVARLPQPLRSKIPLLGPESDPPHRRFTRTEAFRDVLEGEYQSRRLPDVQRENLNVVLNATELKTGSAFRFGNRQSGCWRFGTIRSEGVSVAEAVAASAAYPLLLPALDRSYVFQKGGAETDHRVILIDGGVFENLGISCMEPGRDPSISTNVFSPNYILCCDAGAGLFDDQSFPMWWPTRMTRSMLTTLRKVQDGTRKRLHQIADSCQIRGFVLSYLGQNDEALPWKPGDLPLRQEVCDYPTDFSPMNKEDIERLALRGERITRLLVAHYLPDL